MITQGHHGDHERRSRSPNWRFLADGGIAAEVSADYLFCVPGILRRTGSSACRPLSVVSW
jgi:hypothetical protein